MYTCGRQKNSFICNNKDYVVRYCDYIGACTETYSGKRVNLIIFDLSRYEHCANHTINNSDIKDYLIILGTLNT